MTLALRLGRTVGELMESMTAAELMLWRAYDAQSPIGDVRGDVQAALIASTTAQVQGAKVTLAEMMLQWEPPEPESDEPDGAWKRFIGTMCPESGMA